MKVFLSYSRQDADFVARVERHLNALGYDVWVDTEDILTGGEARWRRSIVAAIRESDVMVLVLSSNSTHSDNVERELSVAADNAKRVIPVIYQECELPDGFQYDLAGVQRIDFSKGDFKDGVRQLSEYLGPPHAVAPPVTADVPLPPPLPPPVGRTFRRSRVLAVAAAAAAVLLIGGIVIVAAIDGDGSSASPPTAAAQSSGLTITPTTTTTPTTTATTTSTATTAATTESAPSIATTTSGPSATGAPSLPIEQAPATAPAQTVCVRSDIDFAALRDAPDRAADLLTKIPPGSCDVILVDPVPVQGSGFEWYHLQWNGFDGWSAKSNTA
jgi:TIR domain